MSERLQAYTIGLYSDIQALSGQDVSHGPILRAIEELRFGRPSSRRQINGQISVKAC